MSSRRAGHVVGGKYELVRLLGRGSMGEVWVAHHRTLREQVALKLLTRAIGIAYAEDSVSAMARFRMEAQIAAHLSRKTRHIVRVTDHGEEDGLAYLVMELLEGQTLEGRILGRGPLVPEAAVKVVAQTARALEEAHDEGIVHRDLKPANVFLTEDEDARLLVKLLDFGIARTIHTHRVSHKVTTGDGIVFGTPGYMSPEQACAAKVDPRCDLWALATVAYEALTGELPINGSDTGEMLANLHARRIVPLHARNPRLPGGLRAFFGQAFALRIETRFGSARELAAAFARAAGTPSGVSPHDVAAHAEAVHADEGALPAEAVHADVEVLPAEAVHADVGALYAGPDRADAATRRTDAARAGRAALHAEAARAVSTRPYAGMADASPEPPSSFGSDDRTQRPTRALGADEPAAPSASFALRREPPRVASVLVAFAALVGSVLVVTIGRSSGGAPARVLTTAAGAVPPMPIDPRAPSAADEGAASPPALAAASAGPTPTAPAPSVLRGERHSAAAVQTVPAGAPLREPAHSTPTVPTAAKPATPGAVAPRRPIDKSEVL